MHLHLIAPFQYVKPKGGDSHYGYGDIEFGIKFRFIQESEKVPMVGTFPLVLFPTGDSDKGLGNGLLAVWERQDGNGLIKDRKIIATLKDRGDLFWGLSTLNLEASLPGKLFN
jgi:hypothetical protein